MKPVRPRAAANLDINDAVDLLAAENLAAAYRFAKAAERAFETLSRNPGIGSLRYEFVVPGLRFIPIGRYPWLIFYLERIDHLEVLRVLHSSRDIPALLRSDEA